MQADFQIVAGDNPTIQGTQSVFSSIVGYTITMAAKINITDTTPLFTLTAVITGATTFYFAPTSTQTDIPENLYNYDLKIVDGSGNIVHTKRSLFQITEPIT